MNGQEEIIYALMEQAEMLTKAAMTQQEGAAEALKGLREAVRHVNVTLAGEVAANVADAVSGKVAKATSKQVSELSEAAAEVGRAAAAAKESIEGKILYTAALIMLAGLIALAVVYAGTRWTYRAVAAERDGLRQELAAIEREISVRERTLGQMKTLGITIGENKDGAQWIRLPKGMKVGPGAEFDDWTEGIFIQKKKK